MKVMDKVKQVAFDGSDVDYLLNHLPASQLREEIHNADIEVGIAVCFGDDEAGAYWLEFKSVCELALNTQKLLQPVVEPKTGRFSVRAVREVYDIVDIINRYTPLRKAGREYVGSCPFHKDSHPSLQVNPDKQLFYCFSCQRKGDVINFIMQIENLDTKEACLFLSKGLTKLLYCVTL